MNKHISYPYTYDYSDQFSKNANTIVNNPCSYVSYPNLSCIQFTTKLLTIVILLICQKNATIKVALNASSIGKILGSVLEIFHRSYIGMCFYVLRAQGLSEYKNGHRPVSSVPSGANQRNLITCQPVHSELLIARKRKL